MSQEASEAEKCQVITEAAVQAAMEKCGSEEAVKEQLKRIVGFHDSDGDGEPDPNCEMALAEGLNDETLESTRGTRQWVFCRAWQLVKEEEKTLSDAVSQAWAEAKAQADERGYSV